jgi:RHS repeat-associated protein
LHTQYLYGAGGQRVKKLVRTAGNDYFVTTYINGLFEHHRLVKPNGTQENNTLHIMDDKSRIAMVRVGAAFPDDGAANVPVKYHLGDHLGSSNVVLDANGNLVNREEYAPYGETSFGSFAKKRYRFTGKERDEESGLYYHGARYYAPWLARWVSCDPAGTVDGLNVFAYCTGNPIRLVDPNGMASGDTETPTVADRQAAAAKKAADDWYEAQLIKGVQGGKDTHAKMLMATQGLVAVPQTNLTNFYDQREQDLDKSPLPWGFSTGWHGAEILWGVTMSDKSVSRVQATLDFGMNLLGDWAVANLPFDLGHLGQAGFRAVMADVASSAASPELLAWGATYDARRAMFIMNTDSAMAAVGDSNQLGKIGIQLADPLYGNGLPTEVQVGAGRRMDFGHPTPGHGPEWEIKLSDPANMEHSTRVQSELERDIARAGTYGPNGGPIGWVGWKGLPQSMVEQGEAGGLIMVDAPKLARELQPPTTSLWDDLTNYLFGN